VRHSPQLDSVAAASGFEDRAAKRSFGFEWLIVRCNDLEDLVTAANHIVSELRNAGFGPQLLTAPFRFDGAKGVAPGYFEGPRAPSNIRTFDGTWREILAGTATL
jgi:hypothetical protein